MGRGLNVVFSTSTIPVLDDSIINLRCNMKYLLNYAAGLGQDGFIGYGLLLLIYEMIYFFARISRKPRLSLILKSILYPCGLAGQNGHKGYIACVPDSRIQFESSSVLCRIYEIIVITHSHNLYHHYL